MDTALSLTPTGLPSLDAALGGGLPGGLVYVRGHRKYINQVRTKLHENPVVVPITTLPTVPEQLGNTLATLLQAYRNTRDAIIIDTGDITKVLQRSSAFTVETLAREIRQIAVTFIRPQVTLFVEAHFDETARGVFFRTADVVLTATDEGMWFAAKLPGHPLIDWREAPRFNPLATPPRPVTPERVIAALSRDPALAWTVMTQLRVLGPWEQFSDENGVYFERRSAVGLEGCRVSEVTDEPDGPYWYWVILDQHGDASPITSGAFKEAADAVTSVETEMRTRGWIMVPSQVG